MIRKVFILILTAALVVLSACDPEFTSRSSGSWMIRNSTGQTIVVKGSSTHHGNIMILHGEVGTYGEQYFQWKTGKPYFESIYERPDSDVFIEILAEDGTLLKRWTVADKDQPGKQFFNESFWALRLVEPEERHPDYFWTFELLLN